MTLSVHSFPKISEPFSLNASNFERKERAQLCFVPASFTKIHAQNHLFSVSYEHICHVSPTHRSESLCMPSRATKASAGAFILLNSWKSSHQTQINGNPGFVSPTAHGGNLIFNMRIKKSY